VTINSQIEAARIYDGAVKVRKPECDCISSAEVESPASSIDTLSLTISGSAGRPAEGDVSAEPIIKDWTILHYGAGDNDLGKYTLGNLNEMEEVGSGDNVNIVAQFDFKGSGCTRYYITRDDNPVLMTSPVIEKLGKVNMADPEQLSQFIAFGMKKYPARHYMLILDSHGNAWKGLSLEESSNGRMTLPVLRRSIEKAEQESGARLDILAFDACLMASTETAYEMRNTASYMIASEQISGYKAWPYDDILREAFEKGGDVSPLEFARIAVEKSSCVKEDMITMSAVDLNRMRDVADASQALADRILKTDEPMVNIREISDLTQQFFIPVQDHCHFAEQIARSDKINDPLLKSAASDLVRALEAAVVAEEHATEVPSPDLITDSDILDLSDAGKKDLYELKGACGLNIEMRPNSGLAYDDLQFAQDTVWKHAMERICRG